MKIKIISAARIVPFQHDSFTSINVPIRITSQTSKRNVNLYLTRIRFSKVYEQEFYRKQPLNTNAYYKFIDEIQNLTTPYANENNTIGNIGIASGHPQSNELCHLDELPHKLKLKINNSNARVHIDLTSTEVGNAFNLNPSYIRNSINETKTIQTIQDDLYTHLLVPSVSNLQYSRTGWKGVVSFDTKEMEYLASFDILPTQLDLHITLFDYKNMPIQAIPEIELHFLII